MAVVKRDTREVVGQLFSIIRILTKKNFEYMQSCTEPGTTIVKGVGRKHCCVTSLHIFALM